MKWSYENKHAGGAPTTVTGFGNVKKKHYIELRDKQVTISEVYDITTTELDQTEFSIACQRGTDKRRDILQENICNTDIINTVRSKNINPRIFPGIESPSEHAAPIARACVLCVNPSMVIDYYGMLDDAQI